MCSGPESLTILAAAACLRHSVVRVHTTGRVSIPSGQRPPNEVICLLVEGAVAREFPTMHPELCALIVRMHPRFSPPTRCLTINGLRVAAALRHQIAAAQRHQIGDWPPVDGASILAIARHGDTSVARYAYASRLDETAAWLQRYQPDGWMECSQQTIGAVVSLGLLEVFARWGRWVYVTCLQDAVVSAMGQGELAILDCCMNVLAARCGTPLDIPNATVSACSRGQIAALEWWQSASERGVVVFGVSADHLGAASSTAVLEWLRKWCHARGRPLPYSNGVIISYVQSVDMPILDWWLESGQLTDVPYEYIWRILYWLCESKLPDLFGWYVRWGKRYRRKLMLNLVRAYQHNQPKIADLWLANRRDIADGPRIPSVLAYASRIGDVAMLEWWRVACSEHDIPFRFDRRVCTDAAAAGHTHVLQWWVDMYAVCRWTVDWQHAILHGAILHGQVGVLNWWHRAVKNGNRLLHVQPAVIYGFIREQKNLTLPVRHWLMATVFD